MDQAGISVRKRLAALEEFQTVLELIEGRDVDAGVGFGRSSPHSRRRDLRRRSSGEDLIAAGLVPGPFFKQILDRTYDAQLKASSAHHSRR